MPSASPKPAGLSGTVVAAQTALPVLNPYPKGMSGTVVCSLPVLGSNSPKPAALSGTIVASGTVLPSLTPKPAALSGLLVVEFLGGFPSPLPAPLGGLVVVDSPLGLLTPIPAGLSGVLVTDGAIPFLSPIPAGIGALVVVDYPFGFPTPIPAGLGGTIVAAGDSLPVLTPIPAGVGGTIVAAQTALPVLTPKPAGVGGVLVTDQPFGFPTIKPAGLSGLLVSSFTVGSSNARPSALGGLISIEATPGGSVVPFTPSPPKALGGNLVISYPDPIQIDFTNRMISPVWRNNDYTRYADLLQLTNSQNAVSTLFLQDHGTSGQHLNISLTGLGNQLVETAVVFQGGMFVGELTRVAIDTISLSPFGDVPVSTRAYMPTVLPVAPNSTIVECAIGYQFYTWPTSTVDVFRAFIATTGGAVQGTFKTYKYQSSEGNPTTATLINPKTPDTYDASEVGLAFTRNHYHQILSGAEKIYNALAAEHSLFNGASVITLGKSFVNSRYSKSIPQTDLTATKTTILLGTLPAEPSVIIMGAYAAQAFLGPQAVVMRLAVDDTNAYAYFETISGSPDGSSGGMLHISAVALQASHPTTDPDVDYGTIASSIIGAQTKSIGTDDYQRLRANLIKMIGMYSRDHDFATGAHKITLSRCAGFSKIFDGTITASSTVGHKTTTLVGSISSGKLYFFYAKGQAGSGKVAVSLGYTTTGVYVITERLEAGSTNSLDVEVYQVNET